MPKRTIESKFLFKNKQLPPNYCLPIIIGFDLKTPENIGNIIRIADNIGCLKVFFATDIESTRNSKIRRTAASSFDAVDWEFCKISELNEKIPAGYKKVAIETTSDSQNIYETGLPEKIAFIVGNEISGISNDFLDTCDLIVHIPIFGNNTSLNVSHALAVSVFEWQKRFTV